MAGRNSNSGSDFKADMIPYKNGFMLKNTAIGNNDRNQLQANDFYKGAIGDNVIADWCKFKGGDEDDIQQFELGDYVQKDDFNNY